ncbi:MAG: PaaI family thioesterase [Deltaproteobacteria bacterium]|nr:PaaI family thioesterase [Deltaproteobacteria bacterium]
MVEKDRIELPKLQGHLCFACGTANPIGLDLHFYRSGDTICTDITLDKNYMGWENMAHGGIISTLLDEVMSWTIIYFKKIFFVTRRMEIKYIQPVSIDVPLTAKGRLMEDMRKPFIGAKAELYDNKEIILAKSTGRFAEIPEDELSQVPQDMKNQMSLLFNRFPSS